jgi:SAM-dependent methyltransferase
MIGLNVGSGQRPFPSTPELKWVNIDSQARWNPDVVCDGANLVGSQGFTFTDNSVDYVVLIQVLEHFGCGEGEGLIKEAYRVLKPGGSLILSVPDLRALCTEWLHGKKLDTQLFVTCLYGAYMGDEADRHKWAFTSESLLAFLKAGPWKSVTIGRCPDISGSSIPHDWWILEAECIK